MSVQCPYLTYYLPNRKPLLISCVNSGYWYFHFTVFESFSHRSNHHHLFSYSEQIHCNTYSGHSTKDCFSAEQCIQTNIRANKKNNSTGGWHDRIQQHEPYLTVRLKEHPDQTVEDDVEASIRYPQQNSCYQHQVFLWSDERFLSHYLPVWSCCREDKEGEVEGGQCWQEHEYNDDFVADLLTDKS